MDERDDIGYGRQAGSGQFGSTGCSLDRPSGVITGLSRRAVREFGCAPESVAEI